jgi:hypothetical protein
MWDKPSSCPAKPLSRSLSRLSPVPGNSSTRRTIHVILSASEESGTGERILHFVQNDIAPCGRSCSEQCGIGRDLCAEDCRGLARELLSEVAKTSSRGPTTDRQEVLR